MPAPPARGSPRAWDTQEEKRQSGPFSQDAFTSPVGVRVPRDPVTWRGHARRKVRARPGVQSVVTEERAVASGGPDVTTAPRPRVFTFEN